MLKEKVLVCLSGGIDSSLSCILLKEQGYEIIAATFRVYDSIQEGCLKKMKGCCSIESIAEAKNFAKSIGIEHYVLDYREYFKETVISNFVNEYLQARTPNPCVLCNYEIKWGKVLEFARSLGCSYVATGHYAKVFKKFNRYSLAKGADLLKDQSYFLWMLTQEHLAATLFPLGNYTKKQIRDLALEKGLNFLAKKRESQEICFISDNNYRKFIQNELSNFQNIVKEGNFISIDGKILGKHKGIANYTVGQRKGLGVALGIPHYVKEIRCETNEIVLSTYDQLLVNEFYVRNVNYVTIDSFADGMEVEVKVRYRTAPVKAKVYHGNQDIIKVIPLEPIYAVTPGQSAVFYISDEVAFGGIIEKAT